MDELISSPAMGLTVTSILRMKKLKHTDVVRCFPNHVTQKQESTNLNPSCLVPKPPEMLGEDQVVGTTQVQIKVCYTRTEMAEMEKSDQVRDG